MKFIERYKKDKEDRFVEEAIETVYKAVCDHAADQPNADFHAIKFAFSMPSDDAAYEVLEIVRKKFLEDDVIANLLYSGGDVCGFIKPRTDPSQNTYQLRMFWSRAPGKFVNKLTGASINLASSLSIGPAFTGTVREWYETLVETVIDAGNELQKQHGAAPNKVFVGSNVATLLECSVLFKPAASHAPGIGTLANRFKVYKLDRLKNEIEVCLDLNDERHIAIVNILDMDII